LKKNKSINTELIGYKLYGIISTFKDYKTVFLINNDLNIQLEKITDHENKAFENYYYFTNSDYEYFFFKNKQFNDFILKKFKNIHYFLFLKSHLPIERPDGFIQPLINNSLIQQCLKIHDEETLEMLIHCLELPMI